MPADHLSLCTTPIVLMKAGKAISQGTGFYYVHQTTPGQVLFLVTNHHVLTGSAAGETTDPAGDSIAFQFHESADQPGRVKSIVFPLFTKHGRPVWVNSDSVPEADVAVIPIPPALAQGCSLNVISAEWAGTNLKVRPASSVTIIGYPYGFHDTVNALPVWKTGNVASEPEYDFGGKPYFVVDVSAFPGMSGSPAFAVAYGIYESEQGATVTGGARRFLGIYASMQMRKEHKYLEEVATATKLGFVNFESLQLGHVWKASLILDITMKIDVEKYQKEVLASIA